jgi:inhibitor of cysteine peptidase
MKLLSKKLILISCLLLVSFVVSGCFKKASPIQKKSTDSFNQILSAQSELKKFPNAEAMKKFFAEHPQGSTGSSARNMISPMLDASNTATKESAPLGMGSAGQGGDTVFSGTNIQVAGVDEGDIVKTDGQFIYTVKDQSIVIVKALPANEMNIVASINLEATPQEIYINGNTLITFGYSSPGVYTKMAADSIMRPYSSATFLAVYNITDKSKPELIRRLEFDGNYTSSRLIDNKLYFITANYNYYPSEDNNLPRIFEKGEQISAQETTDRYIYPPVYYIDTPSALNATTVTVLQLEDIQAPVNSQVFLMPAGETVYASNKALYLAYTKYISEYLLRMAVAKEILGPRLTEKERQRIEVIRAIDPFIMSDDEKLGKINQIIEGYISRLSSEEQKNISTNIEAEFNRQHPNIADELEKTVVHKIAFSEQGLNYIASGEVTGHLLNQYSLDEHNDNLRIATTRGQSWFRPMMFAAAVDMIAPAPEINSTNNVYVLNGSLQTIGRLENLAPGEKIYSSRFMGERAYLVTFKQTDPLFVIDLATPEKPAVLGQVKLPGFSNYLHPYDETTLIGIGKEAIDKGDQGVDLLGLKISLFDVKDPAEPKEISSIILGGRGSDSMSLYDYKAVLFSKEKSLLIIPASLTNKGNNDYQTQFQGSLVFTVTNEGINERGRIAFRLPNQLSSQNTYIDDTVRRNIYINDTIFSLSAATIKASQLSNLSLTGTLDLPVQTQVMPMPLSTPSAPGAMEYDKVEGIR